MKKAMLQGFDKEIEKLTTIDVKPNMLQMQNFQHKIEGYQEQVYLYEDELLQSIILSVVPMEIQETRGQVA